MKKTPCEKCGIQRRALPPNPLPCGCGAQAIRLPDISGSRMENHHSHVKLCPLHKAAPDLLAALRKIGFQASRAYAETSDQTPVGRMTRAMFMAIENQALAAIANAEKGRGQ